ncbi:MAG: methyltransferase domain-containing protein, partial [Terrimicrobiaceae bacterium]|nr:methyltransferase domain-containing protein [Terrimicrobiaceae bacterium]
AEKVIAVDNSPKMVEYGATIAAANGFQNLEYRLGDIEDPPLPEQSVDLALFSQALHHAASPGKAVAAAFRILRPGGQILVLDLARHSHEAARELYADEWLGFTEAELAGFLKEAGFGKVRTSIVAREAKAPHFRTLLAHGLKPGGPADTSATRPNPAKTR